jgi:hypothetical protein
VGCQLYATLGMFLGIGIIFSLGLLILDRYLQLVGEYRGQIPPACGWVQGSDTSSLWVSTGVRYLQLVVEYRGQIPPACGWVQGSDTSSLWVSTGSDTCGWVQRSDTSSLWVSTGVRYLQLVGEYRGQIPPACGW